MSVLPIVLIVDDEPPCRDTLEALLTNQGMRLLFAANGRDYQLEFADAKDWVTSLAATADGKTLIAGTLEGKLLYWDLPTRKYLRGVESRAK